MDAAYIERARFAAKVLRAYAVKMDGLADLLNAGWARREADRIDGIVAAATLSR